jgi:phage terminase large subunit
LHTLKSSKVKDDLLNLEIAIWEQRNRERVAPKLECFRDPCRYKIARGGRGAGAKSTSVASLFVQKLHRETAKLVCLREIQQSLEESVWSLIRDRIEYLKYPHWDVTDKYIANAISGSKIIFRGLKDIRSADQIKSLEGYQYAWCEEAQSIGHQSLGILIPTIRIENSELWFTYNPETENDPVTERIWNADRDDVMRVELLPGKVDNPWFTEVLQKEMDEEYRRNPEEAEHVWGGQPRRQGVNCVLSSVSIRAAMARTVSTEGAIEIGVDVARFGNDSTVMYKRKGMQIIDRREMMKSDTNEVADAVWQFAGEDRSVRIKVDEGYNPGVVDVLRKLGAKVIPIAFGGKASMPDKYPNIASEMWFELPIDEIGIDNDRELMIELSGRRYLYDKQGRRMIEPKDDYKKRNGGRSPDKADALLLCYYMPKVATPFRGKVPRMLVGGNYGR